MLLQSHAGELHLLPALPESWSRGKGFEVDISWHDGRLDHATIRSSLGGPCRVRCGNEKLDFETKDGPSHSIRLTDNLTHSQSPATK